MKLSTFGNVLSGLYCDSSGLKSSGWVLDATQIQKNGTQVVLCWLPVELTLCSQTQMRSKFDLNLELNMNLDSIMNSELNQSFFSDWSWWQIWSVVCANQLGGGVSIRKFDYLIISTRRIRKKYFCRKFYLMVFWKDLGSEKILPVHSYNMSQYSNCQLFG